MIGPDAANHATTDGILPAQTIRKLVADGAIKTAVAPAPGQIQPASIDLRLGARAYRVRASFLPGPDRTVRRRLDELALHEIDLTRGAVLETGCVYVVPLMEALALPAGMTAVANAKSSTGRLDLLTRAIIDGGVKADNIGAIAKAGADTFVAGSAIFGAKDYRAVIAEMRAAIAHSAHAMRM